MANFVENKCFIFGLYLLKNMGTCKTELLSKLTKTCCPNHSSVCRVVGKGSSRKVVSLANNLKTLYSCFKLLPFLPFGETITMKQSVAGLALNCSAQLSDLI